MSFCVYKIKDYDIIKTKFETFNAAIAKDYGIGFVAEELSENKSVQYHYFDIDENKYHYPMRIILDRHTLGYDVDCIYFLMHSVENDEPLTQYIKVLKQLHDIDDDDTTGLPCFLC